MKIKLYPSPDQQRILESTLKAPITIGACGRQWGKSWTAQAAIILHAFQKPRQKIVYAAQSHKSCRNTYNDMLSAPGIRSLLDRQRPSAETPTPWIRFSNGSICQFFSMEKPDTSRGQQANLLVVDEAREVLEKTFGAVLSPMVSAVKGHMLLISTFKGRDQWFYKAYERGLKENDAGIKSFFFPTPTGVAFQSKEGWEMLARQRSIVGERVWLSEYMMLPITTGEAVFMPEHIDNIISGLCCSEGQGCLLCVDPGRVGDPTALIVGDNTGQIIHAQQLPLHQDWEDQFKTLGAIAEQYKAMVVLETNGTNRDSLISLIRARMPYGLRDVMIRSLGYKNNLVEQFGLMMQQKKIRIPTDADPQLVEQLRMFEYSGTGDFVRCNAPKGSHDDYVSCMLLYAEALANGWAPTVGQYVATPM